MVTRNNAPDGGTDLSDHDMLVKIHTIVVEDVQPTIQQIKRTLYSNGRVGLVTKVSIMWWGLTGLVAAAATVCGGLAIRWLD